jgi:uncharacterized membrane protein
MSHTYDEGYISITLLLLLLLLMMMRRRRRRRRRRRTTMMMTTTTMLMMTKTMAMIIQCLTLPEPNSDQTAVSDFIFLHCYTLIQTILKPTIFYSGGKAASVPLNHDIKSYCRCEHDLHTCLILPH